MMTSKSSFPLATTSMSGQLGIKAETTWTSTSVVTTGAALAWQIRCGSMGPFYILRNGLDGFQDIAAVMATWAHQASVYPISKFRGQ